MVKDEAYYLNTLRGQCEIKLWSYTYKVKHDLPDRFWFWLAFHLPRHLILMALVRIAAGTLRDEDGGPDSLTYDRMYKRWEKGEGR